MFFQKDDDIKNLKENYFQIFKNGTFVNVTSSGMLNMKRNGTISSRDLSIAKFAFKFRFFTAKQMTDYMILAQKEEITEIKMKNRLDNLVEHRVLNKFTLTQIEGSPPPLREDNAMEFYCLDKGGQILLEQLSKEDVTSWITTDIDRESSIIAKDLYSVELFLATIKAVPDKLKLFTSNKEMRVGQKIVISSFDFHIKDDYDNMFFLGEVVQTGDLDEYFRSKIIDIDQIITGKAWRRYYSNPVNGTENNEMPPVLLIVAEDDKVALRAAQLINISTEIKAYRLTTIDRLRKGLGNKDSFLKYVPSKNSLEEVQSVIFTR